jgi:hypothetical protein
MQGSTPSNVFPTNFAQNLPWIDIVPRNVLTASSAQQLQTRASSSPVWFKVVPLHDLVRSGIAQFQFWALGVPSVSTPTINRVFYSGYAVRSAARDAYLSTGDVIVPMQTTGTAEEQARQLQPLNVQVLFVLNDPTISSIVPTTMWQKIATVDALQGTSGSLYSTVTRTVTGNNNQTTMVILGDILNNDTSRQSTSFVDTLGNGNSNRAIGAVRRDLIVDLTAQYLSPVLVDPLKGSSSNAPTIALGTMGNSEVPASTTNIPFNPRIGPAVVWRTTPYANFGTCRAVTIPDPFPKCSSSFVFSDVLTLDTINICCSGLPGVDQQNCGPLQGQASSGCRTFFANHPELASAGANNNNGNATGMIANLAGSPATTTAPGSNSTSTSAVNTATVPMLNTFASTSNGSGGTATTPPPAIMPGNMAGSSNPMLSSPTSSLVTPPPPPADAATPTKPSANANTRMIAIVAGVSLGVVLLVILALVASRQKS